MWNTVWNIKWSFTSVNVDFIIMGLAPLRNCTCAYMYVILNNYPLGAFHYCRSKGNFRCQISCFCVAKILGKNYSDFCEDFSFYLCVHERVNGVYFLDIVLSWHGTIFREISCLLSCYCVGILGIDFWGNSCEIHAIFSTKHFSIFKTIASRVTGYLIQFCTPSQYSMAICRQ